MPNISICYAEPLESDRQGPSDGPDRPDSGLVFWHDECLSALRNTLEANGLEVGVLCRPDLAASHVQRLFAENMPTKGVVVFGHGSPSGRNRIVNRRKAPSAVLYNEPTARAGPPEIQCLLACFSVANFRGILDTEFTSELAGFEERACVPKIGWRQFVPDVGIQERIRQAYSVSYVELPYGVLAAGDAADREVAVNQVKMRLWHYARCLLALWRQEGNTHFYSHAVALLRNARSVRYLPR